MASTIRRPDIGAAARGTAAGAGHNQPGREGVRSGGVRVRQLPNLSYREEMFKHMKQTNLPFRLLLCLLSAVFLLAAFAGCKNASDDPVDTTPQNDGSTGEDGQEYDKNGYLKDSLPADLNFEGKTVTVLGWNSEVVEFDVEELNGITIDEAIWHRNDSVCTRLNINLDFIITNGSVAYVNDYMTEVQQAVMGGTPYDLLAAHTRSIAVCASAGLLDDLNNIEGSHLDFSKPWWNKNIIEKTMLGDSLFFTTGDIAPSFVQMIYCVYFNADMLRDREIESPYDLVDNNEWTLEKMMTLTANFYQDLNQNFVVDLEDNIPLTGQYYDWPAFLHGCGVDMVVRDESGDLIIAPDLKGEKGIDLMDDLLDWVVLDNCYVAKDDNIVQHFLAEKAMFMTTQSGRAAMSFADVTFEYGCVPMPKYDSAQEDYISTSRQPTTLWAMSRNIQSDRLEMVTATMECLASEGYRQVTPAVFETVMQYQTSASPEMAEMLALIRDTAWFDFGRIYSQDLKSNGVMCDQPGLYLRDHKRWENYINGTMPTIESQLAELSDDLLALIN